MSDALQQSVQTEWGGFEDAFKRLEMIVSRLERGDVPLEQAIEWFQEGMKLSQLCSKKLESAEQQIEKIIEQDGEFVKKPLQLDDREER